MSEKEAHRTQLFALTDPPDATTRVSLVFYHGDGVSTAALERSAVLTVGRAAPSEVIIDSTALSRTHARFSVNERGVWVEDLGSTNGTSVNGEKIELCRVSELDEITLGDVRAFVHVAAPVLHRQQRIDTHDALVRALEEETERARTFGRPVAAIHVLASQPLDRWLEKLRSEVGRVDRLAAYSEEAMEIAAIEASEAKAIETAERVLARLASSGVDARAGVACFGADAASAEELLEVARSRAREATREMRVFARGRTAGGASSIVVSNARMREVFELIEKIARSVVPVLLVGETGSGKEVVARAIHERGPRAEKPLRAINCGAIAATLIEATLFGYEKGAFTGAERSMPGIFEQADGGTVFLDEVVELTPAAQAALLRVLESKRVTRIGSTQELALDVRVIAAANRRLETAVSEGQFRPDLYFRLNTVAVEVPPLRERRDEIVPLVRAFIEQASRASGIDPPAIDGAAIALLTAYDWPGNVRELKNAIDRAVLLAAPSPIGPEHLSERIRAYAETVRPQPPQLDAEPEAGFRARVRRFETELLLQALERARWNQSEAARLLRMPLRTLTNKLNAYGLRRK